MSREPTRGAAFRHSTLRRTSLRRTSVRRTNSRLGRMLYYERTVKLLHKAQFIRPSNLLTPASSRPGRLLWNAAHVRHAPSRCGRLKVRRLSAREVSLKV